MAAGTFREQKGARAKELYDDGYSCNAIARELGTSPATVSRWAKDEQLVFDRSQTAMAVRAHTVDLAEDRLLLARMMVVNAVDSIQMLDEPFEVFNFGGAENVFSSHILDAAPMDARRSAQVIAGVAFDKATRVIEKDNGGLDVVLGTLDRVADVLRGAADIYRAAEEPVEPTE